MAPFGSIATVGRRGIFLRAIAVLGNERNLLRWHAGWHRLHHARLHRRRWLPNGPEDPPDEGQDKSDDEASQSIEEAHDRENNHKDTPDYVLLGFDVDQDAEDH